jgi:hypothetical protein
MATSGDVKEARMFPQEKQRANEISDRPGSEME